MNAALLIALLLPTQVQANKPDSQTKTIRNASALVDNEWAGKSHVLSLRQGDKWSSGTAWIFRFDKGFAAWKGEYTFSAPEKSTDDLLLLRIAFSRQYIVVDGQDQSKWQLSQRYEPKGMLVEIPLENSSVPEGTVTLSVLRGFFVNEKGQEIVKRYEPDGLLQKLSGSGDVRELKYLDCVSIGETLELVADNKTFERRQIDDFLPPGFQARKIEVTAKYSPPAPAKTRKDELQETIASARKNDDPKQVLKLADILAEIAPDSSEVHYNRGWAYAKLKQFDDAVTHYTKALELHPQSESLLLARAQVHNELGRHAESIADYRAALDITPDDPVRQNALAWHLATCPDPTVRDGKTAVALALKACKATNHKDASMLDTLAAAYAEIGEFRKAVLWQTEALEFATNEYRDQMRQRLELFKQQSPYHE